MIEGLEKSCEGENYFLRVEMKYSKIDCGEGCIIVKQSLNYITRVGKLYGM